MEGCLDSSDGEFAIGSSNLIDSTHSGGTLNTQDLEQKNGNPNPRRTDRNSFSRTSSAPHRINRTSRPRSNFGPNRRKRRLPRFLESLDFRKDPKYNCFGSFFCKTLDLSELAERQRIERSQTEVRRSQRQLSPVQAGVVVRSGGDVAIVSLDGGAGVTVQNLGGVLRSGEVVLVQSDGLNYFCRGAQTL